MDIEKIVQNFVIQGSVTNYESFGSGHINDSYHLFNNDPNGPDYLLQAINANVFKDVWGLMRNIGYVTSHIRKKRTQQGYKVDPDSILTPAYTKEGKLAFEEGKNYWRIFQFIKDTRSYDEVETPSQAYEGALAFGQFLKDLSDFPKDKLAISIPNFHNLRYRLEQLSQAVRHAQKDRLEAASDQVRYIHEKEKDLLIIQSRSLSGNIPTRVTHNDTKFNNVLLDTQGKAQCVIDLDTVMPGIVHYDFGDGIRTGAATSKEDESDLSLVGLDKAKFEAFSAGYLEATRDVLTEVELQYLPLSGAFMAFIMGVRFLTDYLGGDQYYKTEFPLHNLQRAKCQLFLSKVILEQEKDLQSIIKCYAT